MRAALVGDPAWVRAGTGINLWHRVAGRHGLAVYRTWCGEFVSANEASSHRPRSSSCVPCSLARDVVRIEWAVVQGVYHRIEERSPFGVNTVCGVIAHRTADSLIFTDRDPDENSSPRQPPCEHCIRGLGRDEPIPMDVVTFGDNSLANVLPEPSPFPPTPTKRRRNETIVWPTWDARKLVEALGLQASHVEVKSVELKGKNSKYDYSMQPKAPKTVQEPIEVTLKFMLTGPMFERVRQAALNGEGVPRAVMLGEAVVTFEPDIDTSDPFEDDKL